MLRRSTRAVPDFSLAREERAAAVRHYRRRHIPKLGYVRGVESADIVGDPLRKRMALIAIEQGDTSEKKRRPTNEDKCDYENE